MPPRPITDDVIGLKVLVDNRSNENVVDILAVHGRGAHPDDTWCHLREDGLDVKDPQSYINWLSDPTMLPEILPNARIMRYGYKSAWFGVDRTITSPRIISQRLLIQLESKRKAFPRRPLIIVAHSYGGLAVLQTLLDAHEDKKKWAGIYDSTIGLVFFGTPFRGSDELTQQTILRLAEQELGKDQVLEKELRTSQAGDESLVGLVDRYLRVSGQGVRPRVACFFEQMPTNVAVIVNKKKTPHMVVWVSESSGTLDTFEKFSRPCHHLNINKFRSPEQEDFLSLAGVFKTMVENGSGIITRRSQEPRNYYEVPNTRVSRFIGREETLSQIDDYFSTTGVTRPKVLILHALGGQGKSQIALEYCQRSRKSHQGIFWINASSETTTTENFETISNVLELGNSNQRIKNVLSTLERWTTHWILVFDNYDWPGTFKSLKDFFPTVGHGKIIITSRNQGLNRFGGKILEVPAMTSDEGLELLLREPATLQTNKDEGRRIVDRLGGLALAIDQAAAYIQYRRMAIEDFLPIYEEAAQKILCFTPELGWEYNTMQVHGPAEEAKALSAFITWEMSFQQLNPRGPLSHESAAHFLTLSAFLDHLNIAEDLFRTFWEKEITPPQWLETFVESTEDDKDSDRSIEDDLSSTEDPLAKVSSSNEQPRQLFTNDSTIQRGSESYRQDTRTKSTWKSEIFQDTRAKCLQLSLLHIQSGYDQPNPRRQVYFLHPLIRDWLQLRIRKNERGRYCQEAIRIVLTSIRSFISQNTVAEQKKALLAHMDACLLNEKRFSPEGRTIGYGNTDAASWFGRMYQDQGHWVKAEVLQVQAMETDKMVLGVEDPQTLNSISNLAWTYSLQGRWKEAEKLEVQILEIRKRVLGQEHPDTLTNINNLAIIYRSQGRWNEAGEIEMQVLEIKKRVLGQEHPDTLIGIANLASTYRNQGRWKEAEELGVQVIEIMKRVLGQEHPHTLANISNLASTYRDQGRWKEAEELRVQVIEIMKRVLGQEHPHTLASMAHLASIYRNQGRWKEAEELGVQVTEIKKRVLGQEHPHTLTSISNLATTYQNQGRWKEAEELEVQVIEIKKRVLGQEHPHTLASISNLALTYWNQGRWKEAEELGVQVIEIMKKVLGQEHPHTLTSISNLALTYSHQGRWKEAEELGVQVIEIMKRVLGHEHPHTLISMANLAYTWKSQGQDSKAIEFMASCVDLRVKVLGVEHPDTKASVKDLHTWKAALGSDTSDKASLEGSENIQTEHKTTNSDASSERQTQPIHLPPAPKPKPVHFSEHRTQSTHLPPAPKPKPVHFSERQTQPTHLPPTPKPKAAHLRAPKTCSPPPIPSKPSNLKG